LFSDPTPFTPPTTDDDKLSWLRLIRSRRVGPATFHRLIAEYGSARAALIALPDIARAAGVEKYTICPEGVVYAEQKAGRAAGAQLICRGDPAYPKALAEISDAPPVLWCKGDLSLLARPMVALVGARNASSLGTRMARKLAEGLSAAGVVVVSGLARGVDAAAHAAAMEGGTVAVMAGGVNVIYPTENTALADEIGKKGLRVSEQPMGQEPAARHVPLRNRIISGLTTAVVVVEAAAQSGSLITARMALDQGREVFAVPGHPFDGRASGCNMLIRDGATLVRGVDDILAALSLDAQPSPQLDLPLNTPPPRATSPNTTSPNTTSADRPWRDQLALHRKILDRLGPSPMDEDQLLRDLALTPAEAADEILALELAGSISRSPGGLLSRS
jgi:DNA processing protein